MHKILFYNKFIKCLYMFRAHRIIKQDCTEMHGQQNIKTLYVFLFSATCAPHPTISLIPPDWITQELIFS